MDAADISDDVEEEPAAAADESTKGRKRSAATAGISGRDAGEVPRNILRKMNLKHYH